MPKHQSTASRRARARTNSTGGLFTGNLDPKEWWVGEVPWFRRVWAAMKGSEAPRRPTCLFCGAASLILSSGDNEFDAGRIEVYCDSRDCEAREQIIIVRRDGAGAQMRADVRALRLVDTAGDPETEVKAYGFRDLLESLEHRDAELREVAERRQARVERRVRMKE